MVPSSSAHLIRDAFHIGPKVSHLAFCMPRPNSLWKPIPLSKVLWKDLDLDESLILKPETTNNKLARSLALCTDLRTRKICKPDRPKAL